MKRRDFLRATAALAVAPVGLHAIMREGASAQEAGSVDSISVSLEGDLAILDPANIDQAPDHLVGENIYSGLLRYKPASLEVEPDLAESWEVSADGLTYTFVMRQDAVWHRGYGPVTAADVKFSLERIMAEETASRFASDFAQVAAVTAVDDYTVTITMKQPAPALVSAAIAFRPGWLISQKAMTELGEEYFVKPVGSGPYTFEEWLQGSEIVLKANAEYYGGVPAVKEVRLKIVPDGFVAAQALGTGEMDIIQVRDAEVLTTVQGMSNVGIEQIPSTFSAMAFINTSRAPFDNLATREGLEYAVNRDGIVNEIMAGLAQNSISPLAPPMLGYTTDVTVRAYDVETAKAKLAEAGVAEGTKLVILTRETGYYPLLATVLQQNWSEVGFDVEIAQLEAGAYTTRRNGGDYDVLLLSPGRFESEQILTPYFLSTNAPPEGSNFSFYAGQDAQIEEQARTIDPAARATIINGIVKQISVDVPILPLFIPDSVVAHSTELQGVVPSLYVGGLRLSNISGASS